MPVEYLESLDEHLLVYLIKHYLSQAEQIKFYKLSKYTFNLFYRPFGLKRDLRFRTCFKKNCFQLRFAPFSSSPISSFCKRHFPKTTGLNQNISPTSCFLLATKSRCTKKIRNYPWGTMYLNERHPI